MPRLHRDELGFLRSGDFARVTESQLRDLLEAEPDEQVYHATTSEGARTANAVDGNVELRPGDTVSLGPTITKATKVPRRLQEEVRALQRAGLRSVGQPVQESWGWTLRLNGLVLPGGTRTDALIVLPHNYPNVSPIGFYVREGANVGQLDRRHLHTSVYYGAPKIHGFQWFCGVADNWRPGRHTLVTYVNMVLSLFNERRGA
jgi:hypothetical protein